MQKEINVLHICSGFSDQRIYNELISNLSVSGIEQTVYIPVRSKDRIDKYKNETLQNVKYIYSFVLKPFHRALFHLKVMTVYNDLIKKINVERINKVHAHFLFSDGAVALKLKKSKGIPYIVAVRNTDINIFYKYMVHLRSFGTEILKEADKIIFITPGYRHLLLKKYIPEKLHQQLLTRICTIPNGVECFWLDNPPLKKSQKNGNLKILYVGDFSRNKNLMVLISCIEKLNREGFKCNLTLVGGRGDQEKAVNRKVTTSHPAYVKIIGHINDRESLRKIYEGHDIFVMVSLKETFGVVYLEAMSQGLPIIYSRHQGIDGYFQQESVGYSVDPKNVDQICYRIKMLGDIRREKMGNNAINESKKFNWTNISQQYLQIYFSN